jgi:opacity protein-like surface antigen
MVKLINIFILLMTVFVFNAYSQVRLIGLVSFNYSYGIPTGALNDFIPQKPFHGANFDYRHFFKKDFSLGIHLGWNSFKKVFPRAVYDTDKGTVSAVQNRYFYSFPILITGYYYLRSSHYVMPYIGGGLGLFDVNYRKWYGVVPEKKEALYFGLSPEVGLIFPFKNSGLGIMVNGRYNHVFYSHKEVNNLRYFEANVGVYVGNF